MVWRANFCAAGGRIGHQQTVRAAAVVVVAGMAYLVVVNSAQGKNEKQLKEMEIERGTAATSGYIVLAIAWLNLRLL